ncbi:hypothetical protein [Actinocatenispora rupis]|nr:hypothetical protein [Actinocatenispora rupis]
MNTYQQAKWEQIRAAMMRHDIDGIAAVIAQMRREGHAKEAKAFETAVLQGAADTLVAQLRRRLR